MGVRFSPLWIIFDALRTQLELERFHHQACLLATNEGLAPTARCPTHRRSWSCRDPCRRTRSGRTPPRDPPQNWPPWHKAQPRECRRWEAAPSRVSRRRLLRRRCSATVAAWPSPRRSRSGTRRLRRRVHSGGARGRWRRRQGRGRRGVREEQRVERRERCTARMQPRAAHSHSVSIPCSHDPLAQPHLRTPNHTLTTP